MNVFPIIGPGVFGTECYHEVILEKPPYPLYVRSWIVHGDSILQLSGFITLDFRELDSSLYLKHKNSEFSKAIQPMILMQICSKAGSMYPFRQHRGSVGASTVLDPNKCSSHVCLLSNTILRWEVQVPMPRSNGRTRSHVQA